MSCMGRKFLHYAVRYAYYLVVRRRRDSHELALISSSEYFSSAHYLRQNLDVAATRLDPVIHYVDFGAQEGRNPSAMFDTKYYLSHSPSLVTQDINPLVHFLQHGRAAGKLPQKPYSFLRQTRSQDLTVPRNAVQPTRGTSTLSRRASGSCVVYTAISAGYDNLPDLDFRPPHCDFFVFSDEPIKAKGWTRLPFNYFHSDPTRMARFVKLHPHLYFNAYSSSIWIDGNIGIRGDIGTFVERLGPDVFMGTFAHPLRDCIYDEGVECIAREKDSEPIIVQQLERYREAGFGEGEGLWETNVLVCRHNDPACIALMTSWWREVECGSKRDQLSLPFVSQKHSARIALLDQRGVNAANHPLLKAFPHNKKPRKQSISTPPVPGSGIANGAASSSLTIGVCVHNALADVQACLESVVKMEPPADRLIIVDDASQIETNAYLRDFCARHGNVTLVENESNIGYTKSANLILRLAQTEWVTLLNSDTILSRNGLRKVLRAGRRYPRLAAIGPLSNAASWQTVPDLTGPDGTFAVNSLPKGLTVDDMDRLCEEVGHGQVLFLPFVNGFCLTLRRSILDVVGILDEMNFPLGYGEEDDLCLRLADSGYVCGIATDAYVYHAKSASFSATTRKALTTAGRRALDHKHSAARMAVASEDLRSNPALRMLRQNIEAQLASTTNRKH